MRLLTADVNKDSMPVTTTLHLPPPILQSYSKNLLMSRLELILLRLKKKIIPLAEKKIKNRHVGKKREFEKLKQDFMELYERKKIEEAEHSAKIKEKAKEKSRFPNSGGTCTFKRFQTLESFA